MYPSILAGQRKVTKSEAPVHVQLQYSWLELHVMLVSLDIRMAGLSFRTS